MMTLFISIFAIVLDQLTKLAAIKYLKGQKPVILIENFLQLNYVENRGAAFGILQQRRTFFIIVAVSVVVLITLYLIKNYNNLTILSHIGLAMLLGGAVGNLIDRIRLGYVVDFISVRLTKSYDFPVFNIADSFIVVSTILIVYIVLFDKYELVK